MKRTAKKSTLLVDTQWILALLDERGISQRQVARELGLDPTSVFHLFRGNRKLQFKEATLLAAVLKLPLPDLLERFGVSLPTGHGDELRGRGKGSPKTLKVSGWVDSHLLVHLTQDGLRGRRETPALGGEPTSVLHCQTAGSEFDMLDGCYVHFRYSKAKRIPVELVGRAAIVKLVDSEALRLRVLRRGYAPGRYQLCSLGGKILEEDARLEQAHPVAGIVF